jgi:glycosyltransferase involved in cell wall biosynthesis
LTWEYIRLAGKRIFRLDPFFMISQTRARALLLCNQEARKAAGRCRQGKTILFPVNGLTLEELSLIDSIEPGSKGEYFRVLSVGRFIPLKGFDWGLRAFKRFLICCPEAKAEMVIIGEGPDEFYLKALIRSLGLEASVFIKPWIPRRDVFREMRQSDVFLFPSLYDGGGFVVVEAMAAGLPVICLDSGGPGFHVQPEWGIKIPPSNPYEAIARMEDALCRLFRDPAQRNALRQTARARVVDYYRWERLGDRLAKIFSHILDG